MTRVGVVQINPRFGAVEENVARCLSLAKGANADIFVFPELVTSGYNFSSLDQLARVAELAENGPSFEAFSQFAVKKGCYVCYGFAEKSQEGFFNSSSLISPTGRIGTYRKTHLYDRETIFFQPGNSGFLVHPLPFGRVGMMICFDWFFPEAMRTLALRGAQLILHPSNLVLPHCPEGLRIRCLENRVFAASADRVGTEEGGEGPLTFIGRSEIVSPLGQVLARLDDQQEGVTVVDCDLASANSKAINTRNDLFKDRRPMFYES